MSRKVRGQRNRHSRAQSLVEFALIFPIFSIVMFLSIDFARLIYTYAAISWAARESARVVSMLPQASSDCLALTTAEGIARGFPLKADPNSVVGNQDPNGSGTPNANPTPPAGQGLIYIWPAVATANPPESNCSGSARSIAPSVQDVAVQIKYTYLPLMPLIGSFLPPITITTISVIHTEY